MWLSMKIDPVFLLSYCGLRPRGIDSLSTSDGGYEGKTASLGAVVEFARTNNLLGVIVPAELLVSFLPGFRRAFTLS